jgi:hypothetical protein
MNNEQRLQLRFGAYKTPPFEYGDIVQCEVRGKVVIVGMTDSLIPWPLGRPKRQPLAGNCGSETVRKYVGFRV